MPPAHRRLSTALGPVLAACLAQSLTAAAAPAAPAACPDPAFSVEGAEAPDVTARICHAATAARGHLAACGLRQSRPVTFAVVPHVVGISDHCAGAYTRGADRIEILPPDAMARQMPADSVFARLDAATYYDSLIVHELAHALSEQTAADQTRCTVDLEYIAYALQISSLPDAARGDLLAGQQPDRPVPNERLNQFLLYMAPDRFALAAWTHFDMAGHGCDLVGRLLRGEATFDLPRM